MKNRLVWIDLEMSGLELEMHVIMEIASVITDDRLRIVARGPDIAINHPQKTLSLMDEWSLRHHQSSGLLDRAEASPYNCQRAEKETIEFLSRYCQKGESPLCGNSVWQDRRFLERYMPRLEAFLHYRNIDVSSIKELAKRWYPTIPAFKKKKAHLAMSDIEESIKELKYYRENVFIRP